MSNRVITTQLTALRKDVDAAFAQIAKKHGLTALKLGRITYSSAGSFRGSIEGALKGSLTRVQADYEALAQMMGLPPRGTQFGNGGKHYSIDGLARSRVHCICHEDGKTYLFKAEAIKRIAGTKDFARELGKRIGL